MKRFGMIGLLLGFLGLFAACNNFSFQNPIGIPTVEIERPIDRVDTENNKTILQLQFYTLPGSPGGIITNLDIDPAPDISPLILVKACPVTEKDDEGNEKPRKDPCGPFVSQEISYNGILPPGSIVMRSMLVKGFNGAQKVFEFNPPYILH